MGLPRRPPMDVIRLLRSEVGFCCPVEGCGNPYLTWHHFDPPRRVENTTGQRVWSPCVSNTHTRQMRVRSPTIKSGR
jgi:hypothetical protein